MPLRRCPEPGRPRPAAAAGGCGEVMGDVAVRRNVRAGLSRSK